VCNAGVMAAMRLSAEAPGNRNSESLGLHGRSEEHGFVFGGQQ
jgi:hypothetical protein